MIQHANISPLPFYPKNSSEAINLNKYICPIITYRNMLMPFQFNVGPEVDRFMSVKLHSYETGQDILITDQLVQNGLEIKKTGALQVVRYAAKLPVLALEQEGKYHLEIVVIKQTPGQAPVAYEEYVSEPFISKNNVDDCLHLVYGNSRNLILSEGLVDFSGGFRFSILLQTSVGRPKYNYEQEAVSRGGYVFVKSITSKKTYQFSFLATEGMIDALRLAKLCDNIEVICKNRQYLPIAFDLDADWVNKDDTASVTIEFDTDNVASSFGGFIPKNKGGDFNSDFNDDFLNT